ncbi:MAG: hypothetical protein ACFN4L_06755 [Pauljensenia sp.]
MSTKNSQALFQYMQGPFDILEPDNAWSAMTNVFAKDPKIHDVTYQVVG